MKQKMADDEKLRRYLLGQLPEPERDALEDYLIADAELRSEADAVERDLIDDYVRGGLKVDERKKFEQLFLASERRRQKVAFARTLAYSALPSVGVRPDTNSETEKGSWLSLLFPSPRPAVGFALAAVILLIVVGAVWVLRDRPSPTAERAGIDINATSGDQSAVPVSPTPNETPTDNEASDEQTVTPSDNASPAVTPSGRERQIVSIASFLILPGSTRSSEAGQLLSIPPGAQTVRLRLSLEGQPATGNVRAELRRLSADGELVWTTGVVRSRSSSLGPVVLLELPADKLRAGKYTALIKGAGDDGRVETLYTFSVTRK